MKIIYFRQSLSVEADATMQNMAKMFFFLKKYSA